MNPQLKINLSQKWKKTKHQMTNVPIKRRTIKTSEVSTLANDYCGSNIALYILGLFILWSETK